MTIKEFFSFRQNRCFWGNIIALVLVVFILLLGVLKALDAYTRHGEAVEVPDVKGMSVPEAARAFHERGLLCTVSDSAYIKTEPAGCILDHKPSAGLRVKEGRTIYLTVNTLNVPLRPVPDVADNSSLRQAEARMLASGFKLDSIQYIPGEKDWVYGVKYKGRELLMNEKAPEGATLTLVVGDGGELPVDSLANDSLQQIEQKIPEKKSSDTGESWF